LNGLIGDKKKTKISIKFKQGQVGIIQAEEAIIAKANELAHFKRLFNENLGNKVHLKAKIDDLTAEITYCEKEKAKLKRKIDREKLESDAIRF